MDEPDTTKEIERIMANGREFDAFVRAVADHPYMAARRRQAIKIGLALAVLAAGIVALVMTRWVSLDPINDGIDRDNQSCQVRIENIQGTADFRDDYRDTLQDLASYFRDLAQNGAAEELDSKPDAVEDPKPADCNPNQDREGFFG